jgi:hypothetical protein
MIHTIVGEMQASLRAAMHPSITDAQQERLRRYARINERMTILINRGGKPEVPVLAPCKEFFVKLVEIPREGAREPAPREALS